MYNRYIPQSDGSYRRNSMQESRPNPQRQAPAPQKAPAPPPGAAAVTPEAAAAGTYFRVSAAAYPEGS